jgi:hypothetical protein
MGIKGKMQVYGETLLWGTIMFILVVSIYGWIRDYPGYDDTDDAVNSVRSNMGLFIDHGTGCHYLASRGFLSWTELTPRMDSEGNHVCKEKEDG